MKIEIDLPEIKASELDLGSDPPAPPTPPYSPALIAAADLYHHSVQEYIEQVEFYAMRTRLAIEFFFATYGLTAPPTDSPPSSSQKPDSSSRE